MELKEGDIVLFRKNKSFISKAIAMATGSSYTHVGVIASINKNVVKIAEALDKGFVLTKHTKHLFIDRVKNRELLILSSRKKLTDVKNHILKYLGKPYGFFDLFLILIYIITGKKLAKGTSNKLICSEAVAKVLYDSSHKRLNLSKEFDKPYSYITPDDIFNSKQLKQKVFK